MGRDEHWDEIELFDGFFIGLIVWMMTGRLGYILLNWSDMGTLYRTIAFLAFPGFAVVAGLGGMVGVMVLFAKERGWEVAKVMDSLAVTVAVAWFWLGIGGILNGTSGVARVDYWGWVVAIVAFGLVSRVRKDFRFYSWYRGGASVAKDGLAALVMLGLIGVYFVGVGLLTTLGSVNWVNLIGGLVVILVSGGWVYHNIGVKTSWWQNLLQWVRLKIRR